MWALDLFLDNTLEMTTHQLTILQDIILSQQ